MLGDLLVSASPGEDEVVQTGDSEDGVVDAVAFEAAMVAGVTTRRGGRTVLDVSDVHWHR
ncbi:hypothetical protein [Streptomyces sp. NPDC054794]